MFTHDIGDGITMRLLTLRDAPAHFATLEANRAHVGEWLPWVDKYKGVEQSEAWIKRMHDAHGRDDGYSLGVFVDGEFGGTVGIHEIDPARATSVGYWLAKKFCGRGIVTRCVAAHCDYFFGIGGVANRRVERLEMSCHALNAPSRKIPERLGFKQEAVLRSKFDIRGTRGDEIIYGMLADEWAAAGAAAGVLARSAAR